MMKLVVLSCVLAAASASGLLAGYVAPLAYSAGYIQPYNYRGPLSLAPGQPANILADDGRPLDTLEVNLDRAAHYSSKFFNNGVHLLKKRSAIIAPYAAPIIAPYAYSSALLQPYNYRGPLSLAPGQPANILGADGRPLDTLDVNLDRSAHLAAKALNSGIHLLKKRSLSYVAPIHSVAVARTPLIASSYSYAAPIVAAHVNPIVYPRYAHIL